MIADDKERAQWVRCVQVGDTVAMVGGDETRMAQVTHRTPSGRIRVAVGHRLIEFNADGSERGARGYSPWSLYPPDHARVQHLTERQTRRDLLRSLAVFDRRTRRGDGMNMSIGSRVSRSTIGVWTMWDLWLLRKRRRFARRHLKGHSHLKIGTVWCGPYRIACFWEFEQMITTLRNQAKYNRELSL